MAKASLISQKSISEALRPALSNAFWLAGTGPWPMMVGSTPANPMERMVAKGLECAAVNDGGVLSPVWEPCIAGFYGELVDAMADR